MDKEVSAAKELGAKKGGAIRTSGAKNSRRKQTRKSPTARVLPLFPTTQEIDPVSSFILNWAPSKGFSEKTWLVIAPITRGITNQVKPGSIEIARKYLRTLSRNWRRAHSYRTYVEGWFGVLKNTTSTGFHRGSHQFRGLPLVTIVLAVAAATTNLQLLRAWHAETGLGDVTHPLLQPDEKFYGFTELTEVEAANLDDQHRKAS